MFKGLEDIVRINSRRSMKVDRIQVPAYDIIIGDKILRDKFVDFPTKVDATIAIVIDATTLFNSCEFQLTFKAGEEIFTQVFDTQIMLTVIS